MNKSFCTIQESSYEDWEARHSSNCCFGATGTHITYVCSIPSSVNRLPTLRRDYPSTEKFLQILAMEDGWKRNPTFDETGKVGSIYFGIKNGFQGSHVVFAREGSKHMDDFEKMVLAFDRLYAIEHGLLRTFVMTGETVKQIIKTPGYRFHKTNGPLVKDTAGNSYFFINDKRMTQEEYEKHFDIKESISENRPLIDWGIVYGDISIGFETRDYGGILDKKDAIEKVKKMYRYLRNENFNEFKEYVYVSSRDGQELAIVCPRSQMKKLQGSLVNLLRYCEGREDVFDIEGMFANAEVRVKIIENILSNAPKFVLHKTSGPVFEYDDIGYHFINGRLIEDEEFYQHFGPNESSLFSDIVNESAILESHKKSWDVIFWVPFQSTVDHLDNKRQMDFDEAKKFIGTGKYDSDIRKPRFYDVYGKEIAYFFYETQWIVFLLPSYESAEFAKNINKAFKNFSDSVDPDYPFSKTSFKIIELIVESVINYGELHSTTGPLYWYDGEPHYWVKGRKMTKEEFEKHF